MTEQNALKEYMIEILNTSKRNIYTILDSARDDKIYPELSGYNIEGVCLYPGQQAIDMAEVAPYLIKIQYETPFTEWILSEAFGKSWGIFIESESDLETLKKHFRQFLKVYNEEGKSVLFRYYDPRVLRVYLPTCNDKELEIIYGPVFCYYIEDENGIIVNYPKDRDDYVNS